MLFESTVAVAVTSSANAEFTAKTQRAQRIIKCFTIAVPSAGRMRASAGCTIDPCECEFDLRRWFASTGCVSHHALSTDGHNFASHEDYCYRPRSDRRFPHPEGELSPLREVPLLSDQKRERPPGHAFWRQFSKPHRNRSLENQKSKR